MHDILILDRLDCSHQEHNGVFLLLGSSLVASIELLVYVGAIVTLLVFTLMLTGGKEFE